MCANWSFIFSGSLEGVSRGAGVTTGGVTTVTAVG